MAHVELDPAALDLSLVAGEAGLVAVGGDVVVGGPARRRPGCGYGWRSQGPAACRPRARPSRSAPGSGSPGSGTGSTRRGSNSGMMLLQREESYTIKPAHTDNTAHALGPCLHSKLS